MKKEDFVGINENRMKHIIGVANKCYELAKEKYHLEEADCRKAYLYGYLHDVGYAFAEDASKHLQTGYDLVLNGLGVAITEIKDHGNPNAEQTLFLRIVNEADMTVGSSGDPVTVMERLLDNQKRHNMKTISQGRLLLAKNLGLIEEDK